MTKFLLHFFVEKKNLEDQSQFRSRVGKLSGIVGVICNTILCALKLLIGTLSGSVSITADAMNNLSDSAGSIVTLAGFRLAEIPPDKRHPYGHARFEYLSGLAVSAMILLIGVELFKNSVDKIIHPVSVEFSPYIAVVLVISILGKLWLSAFNKTLGNRIHSSALLAAAADSRNDTISTAAVLLAAVVEAVSGWRIDGFVGLAIAAFVVYSGITMGMETISPLLGEASNPELQEAVTALLKNCPKVLGVHDLLVHDYGPGKCFASVHAEMNAHDDPLVSHEYLDNLERECFEKLHVKLVIHYDPVIVGDPLLDQTREEVKAFLKEKDSRMSIHDFRMVSGNGHTNIIFDVVLPDDMRNQRDEIKTYIEEKMSALGRGKFYAVITFDTELFNSGKGFESV